MDKEVRSASATLLGMNRIACAAVLLCAIAAPKLHAQWSIQDSHTTADLRGVHSLGDGILWASGTEGTVLRTTNGGKDWQRCATPPDADHLDFRAVQASDAEHAAVMSSGKGSLSRIYITKDACKTWQLVATNPEPEGFWDALRGAPGRYDADYHAWVLGDPIRQQLQYLYAMYDPNRSPPTWITRRGTLPGSPAQGSGDAPMPEALPGETHFAASNSSVIDVPYGGIAFGTGGTTPQPRVISSLCFPEGDFIGCNLRAEFVPMTSSATAGVFALGQRLIFENCPSEEEKRKSVPHDLQPGPQCDQEHLLIAVGGDFQKPNVSNGTAAFAEVTRTTLNDPSSPWRAAETLPHGYRSSVAYDLTTKTWITVGPNGTDISTDDGRNWRPLRPGPNDAADSDQHWNALSLPFVVGPHGRVGKLEAEALSR